MTSNAAIVQGMADALPTHQKDDDSSDLASSYEAVALLVHAHLASLGFRLFGFDEEKPLPEAESLAPRLPPQWNNGLGSLSFAYKHKMSSMDLLLRIDRMGTKVSVRGFAIGHDKIHGFERPIRDIVNSKGLPVKITMTDAGEDRSDLPEKLKKVFASEDAIKSVLDAVMTEIIQKLYPSLDENDRSTDRAEANERLREERRPPNVGPFSDPSQPSVPYPRPGLLPEAARPRPPAPVGDFPLQASKTNTRSTARAAA
uniref:PI31 proteasome regulator N-terminal domain-containing protein n=1 Tax=Bionectria ochroleuca TaxID=29856 RepID=A0A8H7K2G0_BIOOC